MELRPHRVASLGDWLATRHLCSLAEHNLGLRLNSNAVSAELSLPSGVRQLVRANLFLPISPAAESWWFEEAAWPVLHRSLT